MSALQRLLAVLGLLIVSMASSVLPAVGQSGDELSVRIRDTSLEPDGSTRIVVSVTGAATDGLTLGSSDLAVRDGGASVDDVEAVPLLDDRGESLAVMLVIDVSGSTAGEPIEAARAAARAFAVDFIAAGGQVGIVGFGETAQVVAPLTTDAAAVTRAIDGLVVAGETALYDGVVLASATLAGFDGIRNLIVFSDGADTVSTATLEQAVAAALDAETPATTVALTTEALDPAALDALAQGTGGRVIQASDSAALAAAFDTAAAVVASQYVLTYAVTPAESADLDLAVSATIGSLTAEDVITVANPRQVISAGPAPAVIDAPLAPAQPWLLWLGVGAAFVALVMLASMAVVAVRSEGEGRRLQRSLRVHTGGAARTRSRELDAAALSRRAGGFVDRLPLSDDFTGQLQKRIDQTAWPLRSSEFVAIQLGTGVGAALLAWAVTGNLLFLPIGGVVGGFLPRLALDHKVSSRSAAFMEQLPDTLGLIAGSLKAGYGLVQAVDTVVREASAPTSEEFARVLTETRLGMPLSDALQGMADRLDSDDFGWVVMAINIQAEVGGNLAHLLETVAETLRGREQVRRQVRTLSAEGKLSAYVLIGLVPVMGLYMLAANAAYVSLLWTTSTGRLMLAVGGALLLLGIAGIKRVITIDV